MIVKGRSRLAKFCSVLGLSSPVLNPSFVNYTNYFEEKAKELSEQNLKEAAKKVKEVGKDCGNEDDVIARGVLGLENVGYVRT